MVGGAANAIFFNAGPGLRRRARGCIAHKKVFDQVVEGVSAAADSMRLGPGLDPKTQMGPLVSREQQERVLGYIESGQGEGATVSRAVRRRRSAGYFVKPTVLANVRPDMKVVREEIFGPVLVAQRFEDLDDLAALANDTPYGLAASIWSNDIQRRAAPRAEDPRRHGVGELPQLRRSQHAVRRLQAVGLRPRARPGGVRAIHRVEVGVHGLLKETIGGS